MDQFVIVSKPARKPVVLCHDCVHLPWFLLKESGHLNHLDMLSVHQPRQMGWLV